MVRMRALIVYDSKFGNTKQVARQIGQALEQDESVSVEIHAVTELTELPAGVDLLVIGAPTQAHGIEATMREFLDRALPARLEGVHAAVFDTRMHWPKLLSGSAADAIQRRLRDAGAHMIDGPESFFVDGKEGPLREGEIERAADWGWYLASEMKIFA